MAKISKEEVIRLAELSKLSITEDEAENLQVDLESILGYIDQLQELNTDDIEPTYEVTGLKNIYRDDAVKDNNVSPDALLSLAPESLKNQIKVPKVL